MDLDNAQRLHPLTLLLRAAGSIPALIFILLPVFTGRSADAGIWVNIVLAVVYGIFFLPWVVVYFLRFQYWITERELIIHSGVFTRRRRNIPVDRIQNIDIEQRFLPRMLGAAKVLVYTAGSTTAEGELAYVSLRQAQDVRAIIRSIQATGAGEEAGAGAAAGEAAGAGTKSGPGAEEEVGAGPNDAEGLAGGQGAQTHAAAGHIAAGNAGFAAGRGVAGNAGLAAGHVAAGNAGLDAGHVGAGRTAAKTLFAASTKRALLVGVYRFSLLYIAAIFSLLQFIDSDPMVVIDWLLRGPLQGIADDVREAPGVAAATGALGAVLLGWVTGILVAFNRYYGFHIELEGDQLHRRYGLLTRNEGTIPLRRIQNYIVRSNPLMKRFGWYRLELQTIGINQQESGFHVAAPIVRRSELVAIMDAISDGAAGTAWERLAWQQVSPLTSRRFMIRWTVALVAVVGAVGWWWHAALWGLAIWPLIPVIATRRFANMAWGLEGPYFAARRGIVYKHDWLLPISKLQVVFLFDNWFQRRLGLASVLVDTAGASEGRAAEVVDLDAVVAERLVATVHARYGAPGAAARSRSEQSPRYNTAGTVLR